MSRHILIVDDEDAIADAVAAAVQREGFTSAQCTTLAAARRCVAAADLVVLDVGLPDGNGLDLLKELHSGGGPPVLVLSARGEELDRVLGLELGAEDYVVKPFSPRELASRVKIILRRATRSLPPATQNNGLTVDEDAQRVCFRGQLLELSRQEYRLLQVLHHHCGCVLSRSRLLDLAWEDPASTIDRAVDTTIKTIRAKLRAIDSDQDPIRTVRGEGYCLDAP